MAAPATAPTGPATIAPAAAPVVARVAVFGPQAPTVSAKAQMRMTGSLGMAMSFFPLAGTGAASAPGRTTLVTYHTAKSNPKQRQIRQT